MVSVGRRFDLWNLVVEQACGFPCAIKHLGDVAVDVAAVDAAAVAVTLPASPRETIYTSNQVAVNIEELTPTLGPRTWRRRADRPDVLLRADVACALLLDGVADEGRLPDEMGMRHPEIHQATDSAVAAQGLQASDSAIPQHMHEGE